MEEILFNSEEFKNSEDYSKFMSENGGEGILKVQVFTANQAFPLADVSIEVSKDINGKRVIFFSGKTDSSGIVDDIVLPTIPSKEDVTSKEDIVYTTYDLVATYPKNDVKKTFEVSIFDNIKVIQPIRIPITNLIEGEQNQG